MTKAEKKLMENPQGIPLMFCSDEQKKLFKKYRKPLQWMNNEGRWCPLHRDGSLMLGIGYRIDPEAAVEAEDSMWLPITPYGGARYAFLDTHANTCAAPDAQSYVDFRGYKYPDGVVRQAFDRSFGVPTHVLFATE